jgi:hypothetical protein
VNVLHERRIQFVEGHDRSVYIGRGSRYTAHRGRRAEGDSTVLGRRAALDDLPSDVTQA